MSKDSKAKESIIVRGICETLSKMAMPTFSSIIELFNNLGYDVVITKRKE